MPRPEKKEAERLTVILPVRLAPDDRERYKRLASSRGLSVSDYIRQLVERDAAPKPARSFKAANDGDVDEQTPEEKLIYELHRIGNNLNQLTKKYHSHNIEPPGLRSLFPVLERLLTQVFKQINVEH